MAWLLRVSYSSVLEHPKYCSHRKAVVGSIPAKELSDSFRVSPRYHRKYPLFISFTGINICHPLHLYSKKSMHAADNFSPCSVEGQVSLEPTIMDKFLWDTHSSTHFWDFTEALPPPPSPPHPINFGHKLVHSQSCTLFSLHFPQVTLNEGKGVAKESRICDR